MIAVLAFLLGAALVIGTLISAVRTFVVARGLADTLTAIVFRLMRRVFALWLWRTSSFAARDRVMAFFAPVSLLVLPGVWLSIVVSGYTLMFWATGIQPLQTALETSGSSLLT